MTKKSINPKEIQRIIQEKIQANIPRKEILNELSEQYYDKNMISLMIASTVDPYLKVKYKSWNNILMGLLVLSIISKIIDGVLLFSTYTSLMSSLTALTISFSIIIPLLFAVLIVEVSKFRGNIYNFVGGLAIAGIFQSISNIQELELYALISIVLCLIISVLSFYLKRKLFPHFSFFGLKKDKEGNVLSK